jgi:DNA-binding protein HU-beta
LTFANDLYISLLAEIGMMVPSSCETVHATTYHLTKEVRMTKADLIEAMAKDAGITKVAAGAALDSFVDGIIKTLKKKEGKITLVGFGTFSKGRRKARKGRNPQTGAEIKIKASTVVKFKAGKKLKAAV